MSELLRPCLDCGALTGDGWNRCELHRSGFRRARPRPSSTARGYDGAYKRLRKQVMADHISRYGYWCPGWRRVGHFADKLELDHIIPKADGGQSVRSNTQILCESCNRSKGLRSATPAAP